MRLALISHGAPDDLRHFSGISWHVLQELRRQGHEVKAFHADPANWAFHWARFKHLLSLKFFGQPHHLEADPQILRTRSSRLNEKIHAFAPVAVLCVGFPEAAVALSHSLPLFIWMDALYPTLRRSYAYSRDYYSENDARVLWKIENGVLQRAEKIWLTSEWAANEARADFPQASGRIGVQSFGANLDAAPNQAEVGKSITARNLATPAFLFLANEWERKGGPIAIETMKRLRHQGIQAKLLVVGLKDRPKSLVEEPWMEWIGRLDKNDPVENLRLKKIFLESAFLLLPTMADCTPIVCHEAAAFGLPVLATSVGGLPSTVDSGATGMLWTLEKFADEAPIWLESILADRARYAAMAHAARRRFETIGNWEVNVRTVAADISAKKNLSRKSK